jgi:hypothetical protein
MYILFAYSGERELSTNHAHSLEDIHVLVIQTECKDPINFAVAHAGCCLPLAFTAL